MKLAKFLAFTKLVFFKFSKILIILLPFSSISTLLSLFKTIVIAKLSDNLVVKFVLNFRLVEKQFYQSFE